MRKWVRFLRRFDPILLRQVILAAFGTLGALGVSFPAELPGELAGLAVAVTTLVAVLVGASARRAVYPRGQVEDRLGHDTGPAPSRAG